MLHSPFADAFVSRARFAREQGGAIEMETRGHGLLLRRARACGLRRVDLRSEGEVVELVTDFELLIEDNTEKLELPLPLPRGRFRHPLLHAHDVVMKVPIFSRRAVVLGGKGAAGAELSDGSTVTMTCKGEDREYTWKTAAADARLVISVVTGGKPLRRL